MSKPIYEKYRCRITRKEEAEFVGPIGKSREVMAALHLVGWRLTRTGVFVHGSVVDGKRFLFIAERELPDGKH